MAKTVDVPHELREFNEAFNKLGGYRWDVAEVFHDLLDFMIACWSPHGDKELAERLKRKYKDDYHYLSAMMAALLRCYNESFKKRNWYDGLGTYYEIIASRSKSSALGQFFTPEGICDLLTEMNADYVNPPLNKTINDPACGSGRLLLSFHVRAPQNTHFACDIDPICAKMTAFNMCIHGVRGQITCGNALDLTSDWRFGFEINRLLKFGIPSIERINANQCAQYHSFEQMVNKFKEDMKAKNEVITEEKIQQKIAEKIAKQSAITGQLSLF